MNVNQNTKKDINEEGPKGSLSNPTRKSSVHYEYILNGYALSPLYIQAGAGDKAGGVSGSGNTGIMFQENAKPAPFKKLFPHKHARNEYFIFMSTNPENLDDVGSTTEFWIGEGEDAEPYLITKPTVVVLPPNVAHLPEAHREAHGITAQAVVYDGSLFSMYEVKKLHPDFTPKKQASIENFSRKYQSCVNERDISNAAFYPTHNGKSHVILHHDLRHNPQTTHYIEATLVTGAGIGWGCGDMMQLPDYQIRSLPHLHDVLETYVFIGTNPGNYEDLGATVEFWLGEGEKAKKFVIDKPTVLLVPPNTIHLPMYVKELHHPFITLTILDSPVMAIYYSDIFPPEFEHVTTPVEDKSKFHLVYNQNLCTYPECRMCVDNCQVSGINLDTKPPVIGSPCLRCGQCAFMCPENALSIEWLKE